MTEHPGKYLDDETLDMLIESWGNDLSFRAKISTQNLAEPKEQRQQNIQRMLDAATAYVGLSTLRKERMDLRLFHSDMFGSGEPDGASDND